MKAGRKLPRIIIMKSIKRVCADIAYKNMYRNNYSAWQLTAECAFVKEVICQTSDTKKTCSQNVVHKTNVTIYCVGPTEKLLNICENTVTGTDRR